MTDVHTTLDELLDDPLVQLVMARDNVRPEQIRCSFERARRRGRSSIGAHVPANDGCMERHCA